MANKMVKTKQVTDPLDEKVKDSLILGWQMQHAPPYVVSSGSEHSADGEDSPSLSNLLFLDDDDANKTYNKTNDNDNDDDDSDIDRDIDYYNRQGFEEISLDPNLVNDSTDAYGNVLMLRVLKAIDVFAFVKSSNASLLRRNVMAFLRSSGYNAAICKTKWESSGGLTSGNYEFIDVIPSNATTSNDSRYFIDLEFAGEFEIARQTEEYERLIGRLPRVFVGKKENLKEIVKVMSDGARRSLKSRGLHIPPWRKNRFMQNKWFGPYRRTLHFLPTNTFSTLPIQKGAAVIKCRSLGFDASIFPATTRTR